MEGFILFHSDSMFPMGGILFFLLFPFYQIYRMIASLKMNIDILIINLYILLKFTQLIDVHQQHINILHINGLPNNYQCEKEISYTSMGGSLITNVLVYIHNGGSLVTSSIVLKTNICD